MEPISVTIEQGILHGCVEDDIDHNSHYSFYGIPYAKPPVGKLRFKAPVPADKWDGILDATRESSHSCYARDLYTYDYTGSEDCLTINVFTKTIINQNELKPVMVWIHSGGFVFGSSSTATYGPGFLMTQDVVIVTFNYRTGMLGFLRLEDSSLGVFGNMGMKDMVLALKWVQNNINHFGGDPQNVTIFGGGAGGVAVHLLLLSPRTKGLFHKAIAQSGSALNCWGLSSGCPLQTLAEAAGKPLLNAKNLLRHLMQLPVEEILQIQERVKDDLLISSPRPFVPVVENKDTSAFLSKHPIDIILKGAFNQVPFMTGFTTAEGLVIELVRDLEEHMHSDIQFQIPFSLGYKTGSDDTKALAAKIKEFYFGNKDPTHSTEEYSKLISDSGCLYGIIKGVEKQLLKSKFPIYLYQMSIVTGLNFSKTVGKMAGPGVCHGDDVGYLFTTFVTPKFKPGSAEDIGMRRFVKLWTNFAIHGNPTPDPSDSLLKVTWRRTKIGSISYLDIGTQLVMSLNPYPSRMAFWNEIHAHSPVNTKLYTDPIK